MGSYLGKRMVALTVLLSLLGLFARFSDYHWALELLTHFTWHYFLAGMVLAFVLALLKRPVWALVAFSVSGFHYTLIDGAQGVAATPCTGASEGEMITLLQFNIGSRNEKAGAIDAWIKKQQPLPDIVVLIEATGRVETAIKRLQAGSWPYTLTRYRNDNFGIAVASRVKSASMTLESIGDPYYPSIVIRGVTDNEKIPFALVATHPPPPLTGGLAQARDRQLESLANWLRQADEANRILVGDLNLTPWSPRFARLLDDGVLRNAQTGAGYAGTYPTYGLPKILAIPIDHTLVSPNVQVLSRTVGTGSNLGSDHNPVITRLWLSECREPG